MADRLYRSRDDKVLAGVAGGVAQRLDADPSIIRVVWAVAVFVTGGIALLVYIVMAVVVPHAPDGYVSPASTGPVSSSSGSSGGRDGNPAGLVVGLILVAIGAIFLVRELLPDIDLSISWPVLSLVVGVVLVVLALRPRRSSG